MTIYVDPLMNHKSGRWCHMICDGPLEELHQMAEAIGLSRRKHFKVKRHPYYHLRANKRAKAIQQGAQQIGYRRLLEVIRSCREAQLQELGNEEGGAV